MSQFVNMSKASQHPLLNNIQHADKDISMFIVLTIDNSVELSQDWIGHISYSTIR